ncbi:MAG: UDP-N-acetylmuramate dehydrogenase [Parcubacteria group bacterium]|nr:UDP-N-acetylmuramate dehydrogenase [Parcubacteria group bacterium]
MNVESNKTLAPFTTLKIGGPADFFIEVSSLEDLKEALAFQREKDLPLALIGGGSNLLIADEGILGLVIRMKNNGIDFQSERVKVSAGEILDTFVRKTIEQELGGLESLIDIPGTVGGAIYGNAGAYGRSISDFLLAVTIFDGKEVRQIPKNECEFVYRGSIFKTKPWIILAAEFELTRLHKAMLESIAQGILAQRRVRYPKDWKLPGSFFKNVEAKNLPSEILEKIPPYGIMGGKVQAGFLLEEVGALGRRLGRVRVSPHHGNLFINDGEATAEEFLTLAKELWLKVYGKFGIQLEPEVQLLGFRGNFFTLA